MLSSTWISIKLLDDRSIQRLKEPFYIRSVGSKPTLTICAPHFQQRLKKYWEYQGDFPPALKAVNTWKHWMEKHRHNLDTIQWIVRLKAAADKANKPSLPSASANRSPAFHNSIDSMGLKHNCTRNWLHSQLSDNTPGEEMKSWKFTLCNFVNHYSETRLRSHLLAQCWAGRAKYHVWGI